MWWGLIIIIYIAKEIIRIVIEGKINKLRVIQEYKFKYDEKLLDRKLEVYESHYSALKEAIGYYIHICSNYSTFEYFDDVHAK